jgi:uncharacterized protein YecE (DUF72 family)
MARACIGTSGWNYPHWTGPFYPPSLPRTRQLEFYAERFDTVELNTTFYHLPRPATPHDWAARVPEGFVYAVKASRYITHLKHLLDPEAALARFFAAIEGLGRTTGPILLQLPPNWPLDRERLASFLAALPADYRYVFELRNATWLNEDVYAVLRRHNVAFCIYQLGGVETEHVVTADFVYIRLHGPQCSKYTGSYSARQLAAWAAEIKGWLAEGRDVYCYFDNDEKAYAVKNALALRELVTGQPAELRSAELFSS